MAVSPFRIHESIIVNSRLFFTGLICFVFSQNMFSYSQICSLLNCVVHTTQFNEKMCTNHQSKYLTENDWLFYVVHINLFNNQIITLIQGFFFTGLVCFVFSQNMFSHILKAIVHTRLTARYRILVLLVCNTVICWPHYKMFVAYMKLNKMLCCMATSSYLTSGCMKCGMFCLFNK